MRLLTASLAVIVIHGITAHFSLLWRINILTIVLIDEPPLISSVIPILICEIKCEEGLLLLRIWMLATSSFIANLLWLSTTQVSLLIT
jgi:hypothetical protein